MPSTGSKSLAASYAQRYDALTDRPLFVELYRDTGFFNVGLWDGPVDSPSAAATRLAAELVTRIPTHARGVLEVAAGAGGTAREAARLRPELSWIASDLSLRRLRAARNRAAALSAAVLDACHLPFPDAAFDAVLALEAAFHFPSRSAFLGEACRVLRPGGALLLTDLVVAGEAGIDGWMIPAANRTATVADYLNLYSGAGFEIAAFEDWSDRSYRPFLRFLDARDRARELAGEIDSSERQRAATARARLLDRSKGFLGYFLVSARRPAGSGGLQE